MPCSLDIRCHSEIGLVRSNNQDSGYVSPTLLAVADGMGGAAAGDLASTVAVSHVRRVDTHLEGEQMLTALAGAVSEANDELADLVSWDHSLNGMGTTFCGAMFSGTQLGLVHIGDSRAYLFRDEHLRRLTHDHSWVQSLLDEGRITPQEAATHPQRSLLLKVLNGQPQHVPDTELVDVAVGDRLLLCSDGLCGLVADHVISDILRQPDLDDVMALLVAQAHAAGGNDNITVVLADVVAADPTLDARQPEVIGAASSTAIPAHEATSPLEVGPGPRLSNSATDAPLVFDSEAEESMRYAPVEPGGRRRWRGWLIGVACLVLAVGLAGVGARSYLNTQYYVGADAGRVAIFRGVPDSVLWLSLHSVAEATDIPVDELPNYYHTRVDATIPVSSLESGRATVAELREGAAQCRAVAARRATPSPAPSASPSPGVPSSTAGSPPPWAPTPSASTSGPSARPTPQPSAATPSHTPGSLLPSITPDDCP